MHGLHAVQWAQSESYWGCGTVHRHGHTDSMNQKVALQSRARFEGEGMAMCSIKRPQTHCITYLLGMKHTDAASCNDGPSQ